MGLVETKTQWVCDACRVEVFEPGTNKPSEWKRMSVYVYKKAGETFQSDFFVCETCFSEQPHNQPAVKNILKKLFGPHRPAQKGSGDV